MNITTNKHYKNYSKLSRYSAFPIYYNEVDNKYESSITAWIKDDITTSLHTVEAEDTLDSLALYYYGNPTYYWVIADCNKIHDPYKKLKKGSKIKIPALSEVEFNV